ncbi:MAG: hypothetical protein IPJ77_18340 [Planctomycetes bacterium]|nr:hypothetical protein [Planctomycetota bacterium]
MKLSWSIAALASLALPALAGSVSIFLGAPGGTGSIRVLDEFGTVPAQDPAALQGIRLLDFDLAGRAALERLDEDRSRRFEDVAGAARVRLAEGRGSLYHFVRAEGTPDAAFGWFVIDRDGAPRLLAEAPANAWGADPFVERVAVAPGGESVLVATRFEDGGDLYELDVESGTATPRTSALPPFDFGGKGLLLAATFGAAAHASGLLRFDRATCDDVQPVAFDAATPPWFAREIVASSNGAFAATIAGEDQGLAHPFVFGASGSARCFCDEPTAMSGAGLLPDAPNGPWLAVSDDAAACAWRVGIGHAYSRELYVASAPAQSAPAAVEHLTRDALFEPYLDEVGVFVFTPARELLFAAGDPGANGSLFRRMDVFRAAIEPATGATSVRNLSVTSGEAVPPFLTYPALEPQRVAWSRSARSFLLFEPNAGLGRLLRVGAPGCEDEGLDELLGEITNLDMLETAGDDVLFAVRTVDEPDDRGIQSVPVDLDDDPDLVLPLSSAAHVDRSIVGPDGSCAFVTAQGGSEFVWRLPHGGSARLLTSRPLQYGRAFGYTHTGSVLLSVGPAAGPTQFVAWRANGTVRRLQSTSAGGAVLPGL